MSIRAVIFDRDHTLLHFEPSAVAYFERRVVEIAPTIPPGAAAAHWQEWPGPWPRTAGDEAGFWQVFWRSLGARYRVSADQVERLNTLGAFYHTCFAAYPDTLPCLKALRMRGLRMAVLTNFDLPSVDLTLRHTGIEPAWFEALLSSASLGVRKPDPGAYRAAAAALDLPMSACAFVDDLEVNVTGACALGMRGILIDRQNLAAINGERITSLDLLPSLL